MTRNKKFASIYPVRAFTAKIRRGAISRWPRAVARTQDKCDSANLVFAAREAGIRGLFTSYIQGFPKNISKSEQNFKLTWVFHFICQILTCQKISVTPADAVRSKEESGGKVRLEFHRYLCVSRSDRLFLRYLPNSGDHKNET